MAEFTDYLENNLIEFSFAGGSFSPVTDFYIALHNAANYADASTAKTEIATSLEGNTNDSEIDDGTYTAYDRQLTTFSGTANSGEVINDSVIEFPQAGGDWGDIVVVSIWDYPEGATSPAPSVLAYDNDVTTITITSGDIYRIPAGDLTITLD